jgi:hypothetical protein
MGRGPVREAAEDYTKEIAKALGGMKMVEFEDHLQRATGRRYQWTRRFQSDPPTTLYVQFNGRGRKADAYGLDVTYDVGRDTYSVVAWLMVNTE